MRVYGCEKCGKRLTRHGRANHARLWCSATVKQEARACANDKRFSGDGCKETFLVKPGNPKQRYCSRKCNQQMRSYPVNPERETRGMTEEQRLALHMAPLERRMMDAAALAEAAGRRMWTREQSYANWANLWGLKGLM